MEKKSEQLNYLEYEKLFTGLPKPREEKKQINRNGDVVDNNNKNFALKLKVIV